MTQSPPQPAHYSPLCSPNNSAPSSPSFFCAPVSPLRKKPRVIYTVEDPFEVDLDSSLQISFAPVRQSTPPSSFRPLPLPLIPAPSTPPPPHPTLPSPSPSPPPRLKPVTPEQRGSRQLFYSPFSSPEAPPRVKVVHVIDDSPPQVQRFSEPKEEEEGAYVVNREPTDKQWLCPGARYRDLDPNIIPLSVKTTMGCAGEQYTRVYEQELSQLGDVKLGKKMLRKLQTITRWFYALFFNWMKCQWRAWNRADRLEQMLAQKSIFDFTLEGEFAFN